MNKSFLALALALSVLPIAAHADVNGAAQMTPDQRQTMRQTFERFAAQEEQLHQQMRFDVLEAMTPMHRRAVGATIGDLAIESNPDPAAAAKRIDAILSPGERQRIVAAHSSFFAQSRQLREQMRDQMRSTMPSNGQPPMMDHARANGTPPMERDAGMVLLGALSPHPHMMGMDGHGPPR